MAKYIKRPSLSAFIISVCIVFTIGCLPPKSGIAGPGSALRGKTSDRTESPPAISVFSNQESGTPEPAAAGDDPEDSDALSEKSETGKQSALDDALDLTETAREYRTGGDEEKSLEALDQAYRIIVGVDCGGDPEMAQQKEDVRYMISRRILEIYASRVRAATGTHKAIPVTINKHVEREIELLTTRDRGFFLDGYKRSGRFRGEIVEVLKKEGLPEELSWLPLIESGFRVNTFSRARARALGLWQFIPSTGYKFGLKRTAWIDERMDPAKSTKAAIDYLKELHAIFGDWAAVLAAYNCGEGTVLRAIRRQKIDYLDNFWDLYDRLPAETARYYPRFLAVLAIVKDPARYHVVLGQTDTALAFDIVPVQRQLHLKTIAQKFSIPLEDLAALNPELRRSVTPASPYSLKVPAGQGRTVLAGIDTLPQWTMPKRSFVFHRVRRGENLSMLALKYRTSMRAIARLNRIRGNLIRAGQRLKIPVNRT